MTTPTTPATSQAASEGLRRRTLIALFKDAMDWGRSYGSHLNLSPIDVKDVSEGFADKALDSLANLSERSPMPAGQAVGPLEPTKTMIACGAARIFNLGSSSGREPDEVHYQQAESCYRAMIASSPTAAAAPAPQQGELAVSYQAMPESCGRTSWTAILHRGDLSEGFTLARSEYPHRVRYAADEVRHLIGELDKRPFILDYDGNECTPCHLCGGTGEKDGKPCPGLNFAGTVHTPPASAPAAQADALDGAKEDAQDNVMPTGRTLTAKIKSGAQVELRELVEQGIYGYRFTSPSGRKTQIALTDEALAAMLKLRNRVDALAAMNKENPNVG